MSKLFSSAVHGLTDRFVAWRRREQAYAELEALDDRALADIGIRRAEIPFVVARRPGQDGTTASVGAPANTNRRAAA